MRKSFDGLAEVVRSFLGHDPLSSHLFVFRSKNSQRLKILWWDRGGRTIYYRRLERGAFRFPSCFMDGRVGNPSYFTTSLK